MLDCCKSIRQVISLQGGRLLSWAFKHPEIDTLIADQKKNLSCATWSGHKWHTFSDIIAFLFALWLRQYKVWVSRCIMLARDACSNKSIHPQGGALRRWFNFPVKIISLNFQYLRWLGFFVVHLYMKERWLKSSETIYAVVVSGLINKQFLF